MSLGGDPTSKSCGEDAFLISNGRSIPSPPSMEVENEIKLTVTIFNSLEDDDDAIEEVEAYP